MDKRGSSPDLIFPDPCGGGTWGAKVLSLPTSLHTLLLFSEKNTSPLAEIGVDVDDSGDDKSLSCNGKGVFHW